MGDPILIPAAVSLRTAFNVLAPGRDKASDGWIGDTAHQQESSDHNPDETGNVPINDADKVNEVHAVDVDSDLREFDLTMEKVVQFLLGRCRSGAERRLRYIIWNRRIWSASSDWVQRTYTGASPHTEHAHFSFSYETALEASTASWHMEDIPVALTQADKEWLSGEIDKAATAAAARTWATRLAVPQTPDGDDTKPAGDFQAYSPSFGQVREVAAAVASVQEKVDQLLARP